MNYQTLLLQQHGPVAWITLNRPQERNAVNPRMIDELHHALQTVQADTSTRVMVLTGAGSAFCAGADLKAVLAGLDAPPTDDDFASRTQAMLRLLRNMPKPVIAAINGLTIAGGLELAMCCDLLIAATSARIGDGHANFGVFPGGGGAAVLPRKIGLNRAKQLLFTGELMDATRLEAWGLINEVVPDEMLDSRVAELTAAIAGKSSLLLNRMKDVANHSLDQSLEAALSHEMLECRQHLRSEDFHEGLMAFREKRAPKFRGI